MKAKDILSLCESENLTNDDIYNTLNNYFCKKFRYLGMATVAIQGGSSLVLETSKAIDFAVFYKRYLKCIRELSKFLGTPRNIIGFTGKRFDVFLRGNSSLIDNHWSDKPLFVMEAYLLTSTLSEDKIEIDVVCSDEFLELIRRKILSTDSVLSSEEGLREVCLLIDHIAKVLRLISVE